MIEILIADIKKVAPERPKGYSEYLMSNAIKKTDTSIWVSEQVFNSIALWTGRKCRGCGGKRSVFGEKQSKLFKPCKGCKEKS
jgi:hypothetical protein